MTSGNFKLVRAIMCNNKHIIIETLHTIVSTEHAAREWLSEQTINKQAAFFYQVDENNINNGKLFIINQYYRELTRLETELNRDK